MKRFLLMLGFFVASLAFVSSPAKAQGGYYYDVAFQWNGVRLYPNAGATITICPAVFNGNGVLQPYTIPCTPTASLFANKNLTVPLANPIITAPNGTAGGIGSFAFWATPGYYVYTISGTGIIPQGPILITVGSPGGGGGGAGTVTSVGFAAPGGFSVTGSPVISNGTITLGMPPEWANGSLLVGNGPNSVANLGIGANGTILTSNGTTPQWVAASSSSTLKTCMIVIGDDNSGVALTTGNVQPQRSQCYLAAGSTVVSVILMDNTGATTAQLGYRDNGSTTAISPLLTPGTVSGITDKVACANVGGTAITIEGNSVTCSALSNTTLTLGDYIETIGGTADGTTNRVSAAVTFSVPVSGGGGGGGSTTPGGINGQIQYNNLNAFGGFTMAGDCTITVPNIVCTKTNGVAFAPSATTDTTNASNITTGTLPTGVVPVLNQNTTGNAATATQLASGPTQCVGSQFATGIQANGNANCASPAGAGTVTSVSGIAGLIGVTNPTSTPQLTLTSPITAQLITSGNTTYPQFNSGLGCVEGTGPSATAGRDLLYCDSATHALLLSDNNGSFNPVVNSVLGISGFIGVTNTGPQAQLTLTNPITAQLITSGTSFPQFNGGFGCATGSAPTATSGFDILYCDSGTGNLLLSNNGGGFAKVLTSIVGVADGGTALSSITAGNLICGNGTGTPSLIAVGTAGQVLTSNGGTSCPSMQNVGGGASTALSGITAATGANTIGSGDNNQRWNWQLTTNNGTAFYFGESAASTATGSTLLRASTASGSTASPFRADNNGNGVSMSSTGALTKLGIGGLDWGGLINFPTACTNQFVTAVAATLTCASVNLANATQVTGALPINRGGTAQTSAPIKRVEFNLSSCNLQATPSSAGSGLPASGGMTPNCKTDSTNGTVQGVLNAAQGNVVYFTWFIPGDWQSFNSASVAFTTTDTTNGHTIIFNIATACVAPNGGNTDTPAYNAANAFTTVTIGGGAVANALYSTSAGTVTGTGCAAGDMLHLKLTRSNADTSTDTAIALTGDLILAYNGAYN